MHFAESRGPFGLILVRPLASSTFSLPAAERTLVNMEGGDGRWAGIAPSPTPARGVVELLQEPVEHQGLRRESRFLISCEPDAEAPGKAGTSAGPKTLGGGGGGGGRRGTEGRYRAR